MNSWLKSFTAWKNRSRRSSCDTLSKNARNIASSSGRTGRTKASFPSARVIVRSHSRGYGSTAKRGWPRPRCRRRDGAIDTRASTAITPSRSASSGLMSTSLTSGRSAASWASLTSSSATARSSAAGTSRYALRMRETRVRPISSWARRRSSGGSASALSSMISTATPPRPNTTTGPNTGSSAMPQISSRALGRRIIGCTVTPSSRAPGRSCAARARISPAASRTAWALTRFRRTPSTSDLCGMSGENTFTATGWPASSSGRAAWAAAAASAATTLAAIGMS